jgi:hypothetical protein
MVEPIQEMAEGAGHELAPPESPADAQVGSVAPSNSLEAIPPSGKSAAIQESENPMLDVHAPHGTVHTWKDFFIHLGTIAIGLLIAIGLEQSVEALHHRQQVREMALKLHQETSDNLAVIAYDLKACDTLLSAIAANVESLKRIGTQHSSATWSPVALATNRFFIPAETAWLMMRDGALLSLVPYSLADNYWKLDATESALVSRRTAMSDSRVRLNAAIDVYNNAGPLTPQDIGVLRVAFGDYAAYVQAFRSSLVSYDLQIRRVLAGNSLNYKFVEDELEVAGQR